MTMISTTIVERTPSELRWRELYRLCPRAARDRMSDRLDSCKKLEYVAQPRAVHSAECPEMSTARQLVNRSP